MIQLRNIKEKKNIYVIYIEREREGKKIKNTDVKVHDVGKSES